VDLLDTNYNSNSIDVVVITSQLPQTSPRDVAASRPQCSTPRWTLTVIKLRWSSVKWTTLATVDEPWRNFSRTRAWDKVPERNLYLYFCRYPNFI